jgi:hypothetical protein
MMAPFAARNRIRGLRKNWVCLNPAVRHGYEGFLELDNDFTPKAFHRVSMMPVKGSQTLMARISPVLGRIIASGGCVPTQPPSLRDSSTIRYRQKPSGPGHRPCSATSSLVFFLDAIRSTLFSGSGIFSLSPFKNFTLARPDLVCFPLQARACRPSYQDQRLFHPTLCGKLPRCEPRVAAGRW